MKLGYIGMPDRIRSDDDQSKIQERLTLADSLNFQLAYFPQADPHLFELPKDMADSTIGVAFDASSIGTRSPSGIECAVRQINDRLNGRLHLGVDMHGCDASAKCKTTAQAFETLFSDNLRADPMLASTRFPMKAPRPEIIGIPVTGATDEARRASVHGYNPMTPSWVREKDVARVWPAIVSGATSALRRARLSQWQVNRVVVVHDNQNTLHAYMHGTQSPIRRYFAHLARRGIIGPDIDAHIQDVVIAGPSQKVAEDILKLRETVGNFGMLNVVVPSGCDVNITKGTMIGLAQEVLPMVTNMAIPDIKDLVRT